MWWLILPLVAAFGASALVGAPYLPMRRREAERALDLLDLKPGQTLVDLGSGDGAVLIAAARRGVNGIGYEINPLVWLVSLVRIIPYRGRISIHLGDMWRADLSQADGVFIFGIGRYMGRFDQLLKKANRPLRVVSYAFELPRLSQRMSGAAHLYHYP
ncbi:MAG TPA: methyltransferase [Candidatus Saccharimonadales bacterium]|nr:methyltransferase [Candidatus Saccharimonadales bacterium]